jgi:signal transduction histidine kinase
VWTNIIDNSVAAMNGHGEITLRTHYQDNQITIEIEDNGPGIPAAIQNKIFDPFFTTKPPGEGTGLGLNISHNIIVQKHHGQLKVDSQPGRTCFQIKLPVNQSEEEN